MPLQLPAVLGIGVILVSVIFGYVEGGDPTLPQDVAVLRLLYEETFGWNWRERRGWDTLDGIGEMSVEEALENHGLSDPCLDKWFGVSCNAQGRVTGLQLSSNHLAGQLPDLSGLTMLRSLWLGSSDVANLDNNFLFGEIPETIGELLLLETIGLDHNMFVGSIPASFGNLTRLTHLDMSHNRLVGEIPRTFRTLTELNTLRLDHNRLIGSVEVLSSLEVLRVVDFSYNNFSGSVAAYTSGLTFLRRSFFQGNVHLNLIAASADIQMHDEYSVGTISQDKDALLDLYHATHGASYWSNTRGWDEPDSDPCTELWFGVWCNDVGRVHGIVLRGNNLSGVLPPSMRQLVALKDLDLSGNDLVGTIPPELGQLWRMRTLDLSDNAFEGTIPISFGALSELQRLDLSFNYLSGPLPKSMCRLHRLEVLSVKENRLTGVVPPSIGALEALQNLDLSINFLSGPLPVGIGRLSRLKTLRAAANRFTGNIPVGTLSAPSLIVIDVSRNRLSGLLPVRLAKSVSVVDFSHNKFSGEVLFLEHSLSQLEALKLGHNRLSGSLACRFFELPQLRSLELQHNLLEGLLPSCMADIGNIRSLLLQGNRFTGRVPNSVASSRSLEGIADGVRLDGNPFACPMKNLGPALKSATCDTRSCGIDWVSDGRVCVPCKQGFYRGPLDLKCSRCRVSVIEVEVPGRGVMPDKACAVDMGGGAVSCQACSRLSDADRQRVVEDEGADFVKFSMEGLQGASTDVVKILYNGSKVYPDGSVYTGEVSCGVPDGIGVMQGSEGTYIGRWKLGKKCGSGTLTDLFGGVLSGEWEDGSDVLGWEGRPSRWLGVLHGNSIVKLRSDGSTYEGVMKRGIAEGFGSKSFANGDVYAGEWKSGRMHGRGVMDYGIGAVYRGDWEHGLRSGWGSMYFANGDVYEGEWSEDTMHGNGIMWYWSGLLYDGEWVDGMHRGLGTMTNQLTGDVYVGNWLAGKSNGFGVLHYGSGNAYHGMWRDGLRHGDAVTHYSDPAGQRSGRQIMAYYEFDIPRRAILGVPLTNNSRAMLPNGVSTEDLSTAASSASGGGGY